MEITCNEEQKLYVLKGSEYVSCLGFDVVHRYILELHRRIKKLHILPDGASLDPVLASEIGTLKQYQQYRDLLTLVGNRKLGTWFSYDTPTRVRNILELYRKEGGRLRLFYGDTKTGRSWLDEYDVVGEIGRSTGTMQIPLLISEGEHGGPGILDNCIVRILDADTREELFRQKNFHLPDMEIRPADGVLAHTHVDHPPKLLTDMGYTHGVMVRDKDGIFQNHANFKSFGKAAQYVAFMSGECCEQPK